MWYHWVKTSTIAWNKWAHLCKYTVAEWGACEASEIRFRHARKANWKNIWDYCESKALIIERSLLRFIVRLFVSLSTSSCKHHRWWMENHQVRACTYTRRWCGGVRRECSAVSHLKRKVIVSRMKNDEDEEKFLVCARKNFARTRECQL